MLYSRNDGYPARAHPAGSARPGKRPLRRLARRPESGAVRRRDGPGPRLDSAWGPQEPNLAKAPGAAHQVDGHRDVPARAVGRLDAVRPGVVAGAPSGPRGTHATVVPARGPDRSNRGPRPRDRQRSARLIDAAA